VEDAEDVSGRITKGSERLTLALRVLRCHDLTACRDDLLQCALYVRDHDVEQEARLRRRRTVGDPSPADLTAGVVEGGITVAAPPDVPAEDGLVEARGAMNVDGRDLDVGDLSGYLCGRRRCSSARFRNSGSVSHQASVGLTAALR
jgi:hypothetical protein